MPLSDVHHQGPAQRLLQRAIAGDRLPHAYLFHGPDGVGKETLAIGLAQLLLCSGPVEDALKSDRAEVVGVERLRESCNTCDDCRGVLALNHPDLHLVFRQLVREHPDPTVRKRKALDIGVDVVRHFVVERVGRTPVRGRAKVFIIREADAITTQAQNALLKTLEEPPRRTFLVLLASSPEGLLPTIRSRCQHVAFNALPTTFVRSKLGELLSDRPSEQLDWYASFADGSIGRAILCANDDLYAAHQSLLREVPQISTLRPDQVAKRWAERSKELGDQFHKRDPEVSETEATRRGLKTLFHLIARICADHMRSAVAAGVSSSRSDRSVAGGGDQQAEAQRFADAIQRVAQSERQLDLNVNTTLCLETLINDVARLAQGERIVV